MKLVPDVSSVWQTADETGKQSSTGGIDVARDREPAGQDIRRKGIVPIEIQEPNALEENLGSYGYRCDEPKRVETLRNDLQKLSLRVDELNASLNWVDGQCVSIWRPEEAKTALR
eukprot:scpid23238/ scgid14215/ 